jgi:hypothetical protein
LGKDLRRKKVSAIANGCIPSPNLYEMTLNLSLIYGEKLSGSSLLSNYIYIGVRRIPITFPFTQFFSGDAHISPETKPNDPGDFRLMFERGVIVNQTRL